MADEILKARRGVPANGNNIWVLGCALKQVKSGVGVAPLRMNGCGERSVISSRRGEKIAWRRGAL